MAKKSRVKEWIDIRNKLEEAYELVASLAEQIEELSNASAQDCEGPREMQRTLVLMSRDTAARAAGMYTVISVCDSEKRLRELEGKA